jgi:hypothetical protein
VLVLALLLAIIAGPTLLPKFSVVDNDIWWHLKLGIGFWHTMGFLARAFFRERPQIGLGWRMPGSTKCCSPASIPAFTWWA